MKSRKEQVDVYQHVTDTIVAAIEANPGKYQMPWQRTGLSNAIPRNAHTKALYNGLNVLWLWCAAGSKHYPSAVWASFKQWQDMKCQVRGGEKGTLIVFYKQYAVEPNPEQDGDDGKRMALKYSYVFNAAQVDGYDAPELPAMEPLQRHAAMQQLVSRSGIEVTTGGESACYYPALDRVNMPDERCFQQADAAERTFHYESTLAHELTHATGHKKRLARDMSGRFGSDSYAMEELVALSGQSGCELSGQSGATRSEL